MGDKGEEFTNDDLDHHLQKLKGWWWSRSEDLMSVDYPGGDTTDSEKADQYVLKRQKIDKVREEREEKESRDERRYEKD